MLRIILITVLTLSVAHSRSTISRSGDLVIYSTPFKELKDFEKMEAFKQARNYLKEKLSIMFKDRSDNMIDFFFDNESKIDNYVDRANKWLIDSEKHKILNSTVDPVPSGFFILAGGEFTANIALGKGGSISVGFVFVPKKIEVYSISKDETVNTYYVLSPSIIGLPFINIGLGAGGGPRARISVGLIWGDLNSSNEFSGFTAGLSGSLALGFGNNVKAFVVFRNLMKPKVDNFVLMGTWEQGPFATAEIHLNTGVIVSLEKLLKLIFIDNIDDI